MAHETIDFLARVLLGLNFFIFGLNGFFKWFALPAANEPMMRLTQALQDTGYLMETVKAIEVVVGLCLLINCFVPLALIVASPIIFGIVSLQLILNKGQGGLISSLTLFPYLILVLMRWQNFATLFNF